MSCCDVEKAALPHPQAMWLYKAERMVREVWLDVEETLIHGSNLKFVVAMA